jgi:PIN domain nuclease of toxin-antitoxin system
VARGFLLDTHAFLWLASGDSRFGAAALEAVLAPDTDLHLSLVSVWEMAIKASLGKLRLHLPLETLVREQSTTNAIALLELRLSHVVRVEQLPFVHRDPFDRLLVAQALDEGLAILSHDATLDGYHVRRVWG